ncbi:tape measure protein [Candidatus Accumulibacter contiguus]|nr:tape measure protein [Candidatus Accumulibacter contiguus]
MLGRLGAVFSGVALAQEFLKVNVELENLDRTFTAISGSSKASADEMAYVHDVAAQLGLPITEVGKAYASLSAATKGTAVEGQATREVFESVAGAMSRAGKTSAETQNALLALSQMASKGVIQMEELRGQLGEALPGALNATAKGFGITTEQLIKLTESGKLTAEELFPALKKGLDELYQSGQQTETLTQRWNHFKNSVAEVFQTIGDAGAVTSLKNGLEVLEAILIGTSISLVVVGKEIGIFFAALRNGEIGLKGFSEATKKAFGEVQEEAYDKLRKAAQHNRYFVDSLSDADQAAIKFKMSNKEAAAAVAQTGTAAQSAAIGVTKLKAVYADLADAGEKLTKQTVADAEAKKAQTAASVNLANAFGTEVEKLQARVEASKDNAEADRQVAVQKAADLSMAQRQLAAIEAEIGGKEKATEQQKKQIEELEKSIQARQSDADKAEGQARASAVVAAQAQAEAAAHANNSSRVTELRVAYEAATQALETLRDRKSAGADVTRQLADAEIQAGQASRLYRDALADVTQQIQVNNAVKQAQSTLAQAGVRLAIEQQRTILDVARAHGDERGAITALLEIKRLEVRLSELVAEAKAAEAKAALLAVQAKREEAIASGTLTEAKKAELDAAEAGARVKQVEAEIASEVARRTRDLADAMQFSGSAADGMGNSLRGATRDMEQLGQASGLTADQIQRLRDQQNRPSSPGGGGGSSPELTVQQLQALNFTQPQIADYYANRRTSQADQAAGNITRSVSTQGIDNDTVARSMGLTGAAVKTFSEVYSDLFAEEMAALKNKLLGVSAISTEGYLTEYAGAVDRAKARAKEQAERSAAAASPGSAIASSSAASSVHRVDISINGTTTPVTTASPNDSRALVGALISLRERFISG